MSRMKDLFGDEPYYPAAIITPVPETDGIEDVPEEVRGHFERLALEVHKRGFSRYSSDAILHRIRWHYHIEKGDREFTCNNNWTAPLSRWFMQRHPHLGDFFETRIRKSL